MTDRTSNRSVFRGAPVEREKVLANEVSLKYVNTSGRFHREGEVPPPGKTWDYFGDRSMDDFVPVDRITEHEGYHSRNPREREFFIDNLLVRIHCSVMRLMWSTASRSTRGSTPETRNPPFSYSFQVTSAMVPLPCSITFCFQAGKSRFS